MIFLVDRNNQYDVWFRSMSNLHSARILIAENNSAVRTMICELLGARGHDVFVAYDGTMARDVFEQSQTAFDLIVIRSHLPLMGGVELLKVVRSRSPAVPILFIKESIDEEIVGIDESCEVISKPFSPLEFVLAVQRCLS